MRDTLAGYLYTQAEAAKMLKVPLATLTRWKQRDDWPLPEARCPPGKRRLGLSYTEDEIATLRAWMAAVGLPHRYNLATKNPPPRACDGQGDGQ